MSIQDEKKHSVSIAIYFSRDSLYTFGSRIMPETLASSTSLLSLYKNLIQLDSHAWRLLASTLLFFVVIRSQIGFG